VRDGLTLGIRWWAGEVASEGGRKGKPSAAAAVEQRSGKEADDGGEWVFLPPCARVVS